MSVSCRFLAVVLFVLSVFTACAEDLVLFDRSPFRDVVQKTINTIEGERDKSKNNYVTMIDNGDEALLLRCHLIRNAKKSIKLQTFIWTNDEVGRFLMYELIQAAKRGVKVQIIADHFVSCKDQKIVAFLATVHPNLHIKHYNPTADRIAPSRFYVIAKTIFKFKNLNQRMHNKIMLFDDVVAITGGRNIENSYYNRSTGMNFKDRDILVVGPVALDIKDSFKEFWECRRSVSSSKLKDVAEVIKKNDFVSYSSYEDFAVNGLCDQLRKDANDADVIQRAFVDKLINVKKVEFISDKPGKNRTLCLKGKGRITNRLSKICSGISNELVIQSPYFIMSESTQQLFLELRKNRPDLRIIVSSNSFGSTDNTMAYSANYKLRSVYLEKLMMEIYEYKPKPEDYLKVFPAFGDFESRGKAEKQPGSTFLCIHAKSFVADNNLAYVGSYNMDPRSANLNTEVGLLVEDESVAELLRKDIVNDTKPGNSWVIARNQMPLSLDKVNGLLEGVARKAPLDIWPLRNTSSFELVPGKSPVPPGHKYFYNNYKNIGSFPGKSSSFSQKEVTTRIYKVFAAPVLPIL